VETRYAIKMPVGIIEHARLIDDKLADITVCDPDGLLSPANEWPVWQRPTLATTKANRINELDDVILTCDLPEHGLSAGDIGTAGYEVEFTSLDGETIAVVTLMASQVRPAQTGEIAHVRALAVA
jgi:hypothetical protein